jgi:hypothetical protein
MTAAQPLLNPEACEPTRGELWAAEPASLLGLDVSVNQAGAPISLCFSSPWVECGNTLCVGCLIANSALGRGVGSAYLEKIYSILQLVSSQE